MYKTLTAADYRENLGLSDDYVVSGFIIYGTWKSLPYEQLEDSLRRLEYDYKITRLKDFLGSIAEVKVADKIYWFTVAYGGVMLSEHLHLACLFGSKKNILIGTCGGLKNGAYNCDLIVPQWSYADDSSAKAYQPDSNGKYESNSELSRKLAEKLSNIYHVHHGPTITYQAMLAETWEDIQKWSKQGFIGVEMEASTVFATSNHFNIPSAAMLVISDNLIEQETVFNDSARDNRDLRKQIAQDIFDVAVTELLS